MKRSLIWKIGKNELQKILDESDTMVGVLSKLGFNTYTGNHRTLNKRIKEDFLSLDKFNANRKLYFINRRIATEIPWNEVLVENSTYMRKNLKRRLISSGKIEYKCLKCGNLGEWMGEKIILQLEHKNGINNDNRIENLCFLCPNCHSQTKTYSGKNSKHKKNIYLCSCGLERDKNAKVCLKCYRDKVIEEQTRLPLLKKDELEKLLVELPVIRIAEKFSVSDRTIRNYCEKWGIDYRKISKYSHKNRIMTDVV